MKYLLFLFFSFFTIGAFAQNKVHSINVADSSKPIQHAEVACGGCKFGLKGHGCSLAVRIDGKAYFVDGASIDEFGDAHAADGMCVAIRKADIQGKVEKDKYKVSYLKVYPYKK